MRKIMVGSDFSGIGAFDQALMRLGIDYETVFSCDMDKYARKSYLANYGDPKYYPENVYDRIIPTEPLDIYMTSPPCQAFSLAGKRKGEEDKRGVLFYNSHEFIKINNPRYFIFENVKGLLSDDNGKTFQRWCDFLGGKSVNGNPVIFPHEESVPYHIYYAVLNAKNYGIPQNRERVFIIGIRDDSDNKFSFPKPFDLKKRLKDILEYNVDEKYFLSDKIIKSFIEHAENQSKKGNGFGFNVKDENEIASSITTKAGSRSTDNFIKINKIGFINQDTQASQVLSSDVIFLTICAGTHGYAKLKFQLPVENWIRGGLQQNQPFQTNGISPCLTSAMGMGGGQTPIHNYDYLIRKLTPRECFRLMDFPDYFKMVVSDSQLYKQAGNSICVGVLAAIINNIHL